VEDISVTDLTKNPVQPGCGIPLLNINNTVVFKNDYSLLSPIMSGIELGPWFHVLSHRVERRKLFLQTCPHPCSSSKAKQSILTIYIFLVFFFYLLPCFSKLYHAHTFDINFLHNYIYDCLKFPKINSVQKPKDKY
jgi:hypothetical protein